LKDQVSYHRSRVLMNASDPLIVLYTDASTKAIGVLMQVQGWKEKPCVFVSHTLSEQATRRGVMELVSTLKFVKAFLPWVVIISVPKVLRSDGGSRFLSDKAERLKNFLKNQHISSLSLTIFKRIRVRIKEIWFMSIPSNESGVIVCR